MDINSIVAALRDRVNTLNERAGEFNKRHAAATDEWMQTGSIRGPKQDALNMEVAEAYNPGGMVTGGSIANMLNAKYGDALDASLMEGNKVYLSKVVVPKEARGQGVGSKFMQDLVDAADDQGKMVTLTPSSDFGGNKARLEKFYKRFGFVANKGRNKDYEISEAMYRQPVIDALRKKPE